MNPDISDMIERMAEKGTAPADGCALFSVGYDDTFDRLKRIYLEAKFERGGSSEKFVIGPYGSGKTHFLRHLTEISREMGCVTSEVMLNKDVDFTKSLIVYREVARGIRTPGSDNRGIGSLLIAALDQVRRQASGNDLVAERLASGWISGLNKNNFELETFGRVANRAINAHIDGNAESFQACAQWLGGEVTDRVLSRELSVPLVSKSEENIYGRRMLLSLFQFVKRSGFRGTVVTYDESDQGFNVERKRVDRILSMLQSGINAIADLKQGSALLVYAFTPDLVEQMERLAALQQRVADPGIGYGFFDGNTRAPRIDLTQRVDPESELRSIGRRLVDLALAEGGLAIRIDRERLYSTIDELAVEVAMNEISSSNRRMMVKRSCAMLIRAHDNGVLDTTAFPDRLDEDEV